MAGGTAALFQLVDYLVFKRLWFVPEATHWWVLRLLVEGGAGAAAILLLTTAHEAGHIGSVDSFWLWVVAGVATPGLLRAKVGSGERNFNPLALAYDRVRVPLDEEVDASSSDVQGVWVKREVEPAVISGEVVLDDVVKAFRDSQQGKRIINKARRLEHLAFIDKVVDDLVPDHEKVGTLVLRAQTIGSYPSLRPVVQNLRAPPRIRWWKRPDD